MFIREKKFSIDFFQLIQRGFSLLFFLNFYSQSNNKLNLFFVNIFFQKNRVVQKISIHCQLF